MKRTGRITKYERALMQNVIENMDSIERLGGLENWLNTQQGDRPLSSWMWRTMSVEQEIEWIDINEETPRLNARVVVFDKDGFGTVTGRFGSAGWYLEGDLSLGCNVTHWASISNLEPKQ